MFTTWPLCQGPACAASTQVVMSHDPQTSAVPDEAGARLGRWPPSAGGGGSGIDQFGFVDRTTTKMFPALSAVMSVGSTQVGLRAAEASAAPLIVPAIGLQSRKYDPAGRS